MAERIALASAVETRVDPVDCGATPESPPTALDGAEEAFHAAPDCAPLPHPPAGTSSAASTIAANREAIGAVLSFSAGKKEVRHAAGRSMSLARECHAPSGSHAPPENRARRQDSTLVWGKRGRAFNRTFGARGTIDGRAQNSSGFVSLSVSSCQATTPAPPTIAAPTM